MTTVASGDPADASPQPETQHSADSKAERTQAEAALRASEERWRTIFETSMVGITTSDIGGNYTTANAAFQRMVGYAEAEIRSMGPMDLTYEDDRPLTRMLMEDILAGRRHDYQVEKRFRRKDGEPIWVQVYTSRVPETGAVPAFYQAIVIDISERKKAEAVLRASEERWRTLFETSSVGIVISNSNRRIATANSAFQRMVGYTEPELQALDWHDLSHEDDRASTDALTIDLETGRRQGYQTEKRYLRKDGEII